MDGKENAHAGPEDEWTDIQLQASGDLNKVLEQAPAPPKRLMLKKKLGASTKTKAKAPPGELAMSLAITTAAWACSMSGTHPCILTVYSGNLHLSTFRVVLQVRLQLLSCTRTGLADLYNVPLQGFLG